MPSHGPTHIYHAKLVYIAPKRPISGQIIKRHELFEEPARYIQVQLPLDQQATGYSVANEG